MQAVFETFLSGHIPSDGRQDKALEVQLNKANVVIRALVYSFVLKSETLRKAKFLKLKSIFDFTLICIVINLE